MTVVPR